MQHKIQYQPEAEAEFIYKRTNQCEKNNAKLNNHGKPQVHGFQTNRLSE